MLSYELSVTQNKFCRIETLFIKRWRMKRTRKRGGWETAKKGAEKTLVSFSLSRPHTSRLKAFRGGHRQDLFGLIISGSFVFFENKRCNGKSTSGWVWVSWLVHLFTELTRAVAWGQDRQERRRWWSTFIRGKISYSRNGNHRSANSEKQISNWTCIWGFWWD